MQTTIKVCIWFCEYNVYALFDKQNKKWQKILINCDLSTRESIICSPNKFIC